MKILHVFWLYAGISSSLFSAVLDFESCKELRFETIKGNGISAHDSESKCEIYVKKGRSGSKSLRLLGGKDSIVSFKMPSVDGETKVEMFMERWTERAPFSCVVENRVGNRWVKNRDLSSNVKVGEFTGIEISLPGGVSEFRVRATTPRNSGLLIDDIRVSGRENSQENQTVGFESTPATGFKSLKFRDLEFLNDAGHCKILGSRGHESKRALLLSGGKDRCCELRIPRSKYTSKLEFYAKRWTSRAPFQLFAEVNRGGKWTVVSDLSKRVLTKKYSKIVVPIDAGVDLVRLRSVTPGRGGVLIDDLVLVSGAPIVAKSVHLSDEVPYFSVATRSKFPSFIVRTSGSGKGDRITSVRVSSSIPGLLKHFSSIELVGGKVGVIGDAKVLSTGRLNKGETAIDFSLDYECKPGENRFWVRMQPREGFKLPDVFDLSLLSVKVNSGKDFLRETKKLRWDIPLRDFLFSPLDEMKHKSGSPTWFGKPSVVRSKKGALVAVATVNFMEEPRFPGSQDIVVKRSEDGGKTWGKAIVAVDLGKDSEAYANGNGVGTPCVVNDVSSGRIWIVCSWIHGDNEFSKSGTGFSKMDTVQTIVSYSDDDGLTWSKPENITKSVKPYEYFLVRPVSQPGINKKKGKYLLPAIVQSGEFTPDGRKIGVQRPGVIYSNDGGRSWKMNHAENQADQCSLFLYQGKTYVMYKNRTKAAVLEYRVDGDRAVWGESSIKVPSAALTRDQRMLVVGGDLVCVSLSSRDERQLILYRSKDGGKSWGEKELIDSSVQSFNGLVGEAGELHIMYEVDGAVLYKVLK